MDVTDSKPRNGVILAIAGLVLGAPSIMLWLGRWKLALVYFLASLAIIALCLAFSRAGAFTGIKLSIEVVRLALLPVAITGIVHAFRLGRLPLPGAWYSPWYIALVAPIAILLLVAFAIRTLLLQPFHIPSGSNEPNIMVGDYVFVSKSAYGYSRYSFPYGVFDFAGRSGGALPARGDMAVFRHAQNTDIDYIKRVIGLPGDRVQMKGGVLHINGEAAMLVSVTPGPALDTGDGGKFFRETLPGGHSYVVKDIDPDSSGDNTEEYLVPEGQYFTLGDNRDNSQDSRQSQFGFIPAENFIGPVSFRFWNSEGFPVQGRPEEAP
jgi:signal peptidase I